LDSFANTSSFSVIFDHFRNFGFECLFVESINFIFFPKKSWSCEQNGLPPQKVPLFVAFFAAKKMPIPKKKS
jgi:hypothetical protein